MRNVTEKNIAVAIILSIVTCGIYALIWLCNINDDINTLADDTTATSGGMVILFSFLTCGIYTFFWMYKMGEKCDRISGKQNGNSGILYLVLTLFGLGIVCYGLMQDTINNCVKGTVQDV